MSNNRKVSKKQIKPLIMQFISRSKRESKKNKVTKKGERTREIEREIEREIKKEGKIGAQSKYPDKCLIRKIFMRLAVKMYLSDLFKAFNKPEQEGTK